ncbi:MFS transporter [Nocardioides mangrovicus]|uniref:Putative proline/betaine transporter n=1 Tax=Nocardioides mangrovicus TaxID=2478913 RepID=A0A3L8NY24_9ACTN|nr:MFS transporter [Nocardioides mangrovicus]RLV47731.1 MFS transporter [Nocardioides mangrovicus]
MTSTAIDDARHLPRRAAAAGWIGSAMEYYDFFIYGTAAALVFGKVFFPDSSPASGTLLALATFGVGYLARPLGGLVLGHVGDRLGRRNVLVFTLVLMGTSTFLIGCLPSHASIGVAAPILLVVLRLLQGFSAGGEQAGANSMSLEHAPEGRRAFFTSFTLGGTQGGLVLATAVFLPIASLPEDQLLSWGWRVPFWASIVVLGVGVVIRSRLTETPVFAAEAERDHLSRLPIADLLRDHLGSLIRVVFAATIASVSTIFSPYALSYAVNNVGLSKTPMLWVVVLANLLAIVMIPTLGMLSDRIGRKPVFLAGSLGLIVMTTAFLYSISTGSYPLIFITGILMFGVPQAATSAVWPSFYAEMFPASVRYTGTALGTQIGFAFGGFVPSIASALGGDGVGAWWPVSLLVAVICLVNVTAVATGRETYRVPTARLGLDRTPLAQPARAAG